MTCKPCTKHVCMNVCQFVYFKDSSKVVIAIRQIQLIKESGVNIHIF